MRVEVMSTTVTPFLRPRPSAAVADRPFRGDQCAAGVGALRVQDADGDVHGPRRAESSPGAAPWRRSRPARRLPRTRCSAPRPGPRRRRVGGQHAVDVGPDLDLGRAEARADNRRRVVGAAAAERGRHPVPGGADEAADDRDPAAASSGSRMRHSAARGLGEQRRRRLVLAVGMTTTERASTQVAGSRGVERGGDDAAGEEFAGRRRWRPSSAARPRGGRRGPATMRSSSANSRASLFHRTAPAGRAR